MSIIDGRKIEECIVTDDTDTKIECLENQLQLAEEALTKINAALKQPPGLEPHEVADLAVACINVLLVECPFVGWAYYHDGMNETEDHPILTLRRWSRVEEPWTEVPLYAPVPASRFEAVFGGSKRHQP